MPVFTAILLDSIRLLRARALFWVALVVSALMALIYLSISPSEHGISVMFGMAELKMPYFRRGSGNEELFYLGMFSNVMVGMWLSWGAVLLAMISCAPIFPDFMAEGAIGMAVSKPAGRLKLFCYKYLCSLLFVALQTALFCLIALIAIRWRIGVWKFEVLWAVPLVILVFSYLYAAVVLVAVRTRSVLAGIMAGLVFWLFAWGVQAAESVSYQFAQGWADDQGQPSVAGQQIHRAMAVVNAVMPKTAETIQLLDRWLSADGKRGLSNTRFVSGVFGMGGAGGQSQESQMQARMSPAYIIGTSLGFELLLLALAARAFCRRDF